MACAPPPPDRRHADESFTYRLFGLHVRANCRVPGAAPTAASAPPDLEITVHDAGARRREELEGQALYTNPTPHSITGAPMLRVVRRVADGSVVLSHGDGTTCTIDAAAARLSVGWPTDVLDDPWDFVLGFGMGCLLTLRGIVCLHAVAVSLDDAAVLLVGRPGVGKTTVAAGLALRGARVVADDVAAVAVTSAGIAVHPGITDLRPRAVSLPALQALSPPADFWTSASTPEFVDIVLPAERRATGGPVRIGSVWMLAPNADTQGVSIEPVESAEAVVQIVADSWGSRVQDRAMRAREFEVVGRAMNESPVWRLRYGADPQWLARAVEAVLVRHRDRAGRTSPVS